MLLHKTVASIIGLVLLLTFTGVQSNQLLEQKFERELRKAEQKFKEELRKAKEELRNEFQAKLDAGGVDQDSLAIFEEMTKVHAEKSCQDLALHGVEKSGLYYIDTDGVKVGQKPFKTYCDFQDDGSSLTKIHHDIDSPHTMDQCNEGPGCAKVEFTYEIAMPQLKNLIQSSEHCYQELQVDCNAAALQYREDQLGWITDTNGNERYLSELLCTNSQSKCNCDERKHEWQSDSGKIEDKEVLPVVSLSYGPLNSHDSFRVTLGPLICTGIKASDSNDEGSATKSLEELKIAVTANKDDIEDLKVKSFFISSGKFCY